MGQGPEKKLPYGGKTNMPMGMVYLFPWWCAVHWKIHKYTYGNTVSCVLSWSPLSIFQASQTSMEEVKTSHSCLHSITWRKEVSESPRPPLFPSPSPKKKLEKEKKNHPKEKRKEGERGEKGGRKGDHQKILECHQVWFSHFFHKGYKYTESCVMDVAELSPVWHLSYDLTVRTEQNMAAIHSF